MSDIKRQPTLINDEYLKAYSLFPENYDLTEIKNFVPIAEQIHILPILGIKLFEELIDQVSNNALTEENSTLLLEIYKVEGIAVMYEALPFVWSHISAVGITKGKSDNSDSVENKDMSYINTHLKSQLDYTKKYLKDWLNEYSDNFPLYENESDCSRPKIDTSDMKFDIYGLKKDPIEVI